jgi:thiol-disulfide isomerase/thioredoxin
MPSLPFTARLRPGAVAALALGLAACGGSAAPGVTIRAETIAPYTGPSLGVVAAASPSPAPALEGTDPVTGKEVSLDAYAGRPVVVNFWASWCGGCREEANALRQFADAHPEAVVLGVDTNDSTEDAQSFYKRYGLRHPTISDPGGSLAARYAVPGLPTTFFLDRRHRIVAKVYGAAGLATFEQGLQRGKASG